MADTEDNDKDLKRAGSVISQSETRSMASKNSRSSAVSKISLSSKLSGLVRTGTSVALSFKGSSNRSTQMSAAVDVEKGDAVETMSLVTVRKEESIESDIVMELAIGTVVTIVEVGENRRIKVKTQEGHPTPAEGWISSKTKLNEPLVAKLREDVSGTAVFEAGGQHEVQSVVTVRGGESLDSLLLGEMQPGTLVKILEIGKTNKRRAKVSSSDIEGWISTSTKDGELLIGKVEDGAKQDNKASLFGGNKVKDLLESSRAGDFAKLKKTVEGSQGLMSRFASRLNINASDIRGKTPLIYSCAFGHKDIAEFLLTRKEVEVNLLDDTQKSALHHACKGAKASRDGTGDDIQADIVKLLLKAGAQLEARDHNGCTALMFAAANGFILCAGALITSEAQLNCKDFEGNSALAYAKQFSQAKVVQLLREKGADPTDSDKEEEDEAEDAAAPASAAGAPAAAAPASAAEAAEAPAAGEEKPKAKTKAKAKAKTSKTSKDGEEAGEEKEEGGDAKPKAKGKAKGKAKAKAKMGAAMIEAMGGAELVTEVVVQEVAKEEEDEKTTSLRKLEEVLKTVVSHKELESVIQQCEACGASEEELKAAKDKVQELRQKQDAEIDLVAAMETKDVDALKAAIEKAKEAKLPKNDIDAATKVLNEEMPKVEARAALRAAQAAGNPKVMKEAIAKAKKAGVSAEELKEWEDMLANSENKEKAQAALDAALKSLIIGDLKWAIQQGRSAGLDPANIAAAEEVLKVEEPKQLARQEIATALESMDEAALEKAVASAKAAGLPEKEYMACEEAIEKKKKQKELLAGVLKALEESKTADMTDIDSVKEAKEKLSVAISEALEMGVPEAALFDAEMRRKKLHNTVEDLKGAIRVFCRIRPMNKREKDLNDHTVTSQIDPMTLEVKEDKGTKHNFCFDAVFTPGTQEEIFEDCKDLVQSACDGYNVTLFAYGQTGAGKTFTMAGVPGMVGVSPRTIEEIFRLTKTLESRFQFTVFGSMLELYCQDLVDLLAKGNPAAAKSKLQIREQKDKTITVENLSLEQCFQASDLHKLLDKGMKNRAVSATAMNSESSRSHLVLMIQIISVNHETKETLKGKILIVDLAGSERLGKSQTTGQAQKESIEINKSLTCLGNVIEALTSPKKGQVIPYRDSNLTLVMKDALGGTAKTLMFVNCSPASNNIDETINSLKYAQRAKRVENAQEKKKDKK